jgi:hypothetical protein
LSKPEKLISLDATNNRLLEENLNSIKSLIDWERRELCLDNETFSEISQNFSSQKDQSGTQRELTRHLSTMSTSSSSSGTTTSSIPLSPTLTMSSGFIDKFTSKNKTHELTKKNDQLTFELEEIKKELIEEKDKNNDLQNQLDETKKQIQSLLEKILFQNKLIQSREELIRAQKEIINTKDRLIDNLDNNNPNHHRNIL